MGSLVRGMLGNAAIVTVLAAAIVIAARFCRRPALIHGVCLLAMLKLVTPPVVSVPLPDVENWFASEPAPVLPESVDLPPAPAEGPPIPDELDLDVWPEEPIPEGVPAAWTWEVVALGIVLVGAVAWWMLSAVRIARFHRILREMAPMPTEWQAEADAMAARLGLRRAPPACLVPGAVPPMLWAFGLRARLLLPDRLWTTLGDDERAALLLHELAHLKRRDHWVRWLELAVVGLYWWHPAVWWLRALLREAEEQCCDAWVVWAMPRGGAKTYAAALVAALEFVSGARPAPVAAASATIGGGHLSSLKRRLRMIVTARTPRGLSWAGRLAVAGFSALLLPLAPSWARKDPPPPSYAELDREIRALDGRIAADLKAIEPPARPRGDQAREAESRITDDRYARATAKLFKYDTELIEAQAALDTAKAQLARAQEAATAGDARRTRLQNEQLEERINEEFKKDPELQPLIAEINKAREQLERTQSHARDANEPALVAERRHVQKLERRWTELWERKHDEIKKRLDVTADRRAEALAEEVRQAEAAVEQVQRKREAMRQMLAELSRARAQDRKPREARPDDEDDEPRREARGREAAERTERELKDLTETLGKDLDPLAEAIRRSLSRALDEVQQALKKEGMTAEDLRRALEKSREDIQESLRSGGPIEKEMREAAERARKDVQEAVERHMEEFRRGRKDAEGPMEEARERQRKMAEDMRQRMERQRQEAQERRARARQEVERAREAARGRARERKEEPRESRERSGRPSAKAGPAPDGAQKGDLGESGREQLDAARREINELREQLGAAKRRLEAMQELRRRDQPGTPAPPVPPRRPDPPARPDAGRPRDDDRRFRELEDKMDRLLKELEEIKGRAEKPGTDRR